MTRRSSGSSTDSLVMSDVVILGGGLAGLTLARHILLETERDILLLERRPTIPATRQKVGESTVQLAGYYLAKVLDLEEILVEQHLMKYNLRFYWPSAGKNGSQSLSDYSQVFVRPFSNIASYQLDRNVLESELLRLNSENERFELRTGVSKLEVELNGHEGHEGHGHRVRFSTGENGREEVVAPWVVDATGRGRHFGRKLPDQEKTPAFRHGSFFWWVEGRVDIERLGPRSRTERRLDPRRRQLGHLPQFLATNHFMAEGMWFWVIPLRGKTSLGIVYDRERVAQDEVFSVEKATRFVCERFPLFARVLTDRKVLDFGGLKDFALDCDRTISPQRWAITGEAGRFSDPLYSPGSDLIAVHNTLIVDAIENESDDLTSRCRRHERMMRALYSAYVPSYSKTYDALGDPRAFAYKYAWELSVYFAFYVFPFINDLFTDRSFVAGFARRFAALGSINTGLHQLLHDYYHWRKRNWSRQGIQCEETPTLFDLMRVGPLARAETTFYEVGVPVAEAKAILRRQLFNLEDLARLICASIAAEVSGDRRALDSHEFVAKLDVRNLRFEPENWRLRLADLNESREWPWPFDTSVLVPELISRGANALVGASEHNE